MKNSEYTPIIAKNLLAGNSCDNCRFSERLTNKCNAIDENNNSQMLKVIGNTCELWEEKMYKCSNCVYFRNDSFCHLQGYIRSTSSNGSCNKWFNMKSKI